MSGKDPEDVQAILNTLLVPMDPPNRSQWRKLELAMKFISISKQSAGVTKQDKSHDQKSIGNNDFERKGATNNTKCLQRNKRPLQSEDSAERQKITMKLEPLEKRKSTDGEAGGGNEKARQMKKQNSWGDKLKHCAVQIM